MKPIRRSYNSETDLDAVLALKQVCTTPQNIYDPPTTSDLQRLLAPEALPLTATSDEPSKRKTYRGMAQEQAQRIMTQHLTAVWEDTSGTMLAYALIAQPGSCLTFQVHPQVREQGLETAVLAWGLEQMQAIAQASHTSRDLWCRCHEVEQGRRSILEAAGFQPLPERDMRLVHPLAQLLVSVALPEGFSLKLGVKPSELDAYQDLHRAVFDGMSMGMNYHQSSAYQPDLDLIAVEPNGRFGAFCQCELKQVMGSQGEQRVGEVGVIGTRPELRHQGLGRALLLTGLRQLQERGVTCAFLETQEPNAPAQRLFTSVGFMHRSTWQWYTKTVVPLSLPALPFV